MINLLPVSPSRIVGLDAHGCVDPMSWRNGPKFGHIFFKQTSVCHLSIQLTEVTIMSLPVPPPEYDHSPLLSPGEGEAPRREGDHVHDDFKYSTVIVECTLPIRQAFIRKVYAILSAQLLLTVGIGAVISMNLHVKAWALSHIWVFYLSMIGSIGFVLGALFKQRTYPTNIILLGGFTICESYLVGVVSSLYDTNIVIEAALITMVVFAGLTVLACQSTYDFTGWMGYLGAGLWMLIGFGFIAMFFPYSSSMDLVYSCLGAIIFCGYILVDTQLIMKRYHPEDEVAAAISLYLDIINLFLNILRILNEVNDSN